MAQHTLQEQKTSDPDSPGRLLQGIQDNTILMARLKLLFVEAKVVAHSNREKVKYSIHDARVLAIQRFLKFLDNARSHERPWLQQALWPLVFSLIPS